MTEILVIDNDNNYNQYIVSMLLSEGFNAIGVIHAEHGLKLLDTQPFHLIITEIVMPERDGIEVILSIKEKKIVIPVIAVSGGGTKLGPEYYLNLAQQFGVKYTFVKPFIDALFIYAIKKCLTKRSL